MEEEKSRLAFVSIRVKIHLYFNIRKRIDGDCCVKKNTNLKYIYIYFLIKYNVKL